MKKIAILALLVLTSACAARKTGDEVQRRINEEKASGEWDRRPEVALYNHVVYNQKGSCETGNLKFNGVTIRIPNAKPDNVAISMNIFLKPDQTYKAYWRTLTVLASGDVTFGADTMIEGKWTARTDYGLDLKGLGIAQFDEKFATGKVKLAGDPIKAITEATEGLSYIEDQDMNVDGQSVHTLCP